MPLTSAAAARIDKLAGPPLLTISLLRAVVALRARALTPRFVGLTSIFCVPIVLSGVLSWLTPRWYLVPRHRTAVALAIRLITTACVSFPHATPKLPTASTASFSWYWLVNSHALTACYVALGWPLPVGTHLCATVVQLAMLAYLGVGRCGLPDGPCAGGSGGLACGLRYPGFLSHLPHRYFHAVAGALDWPFYFVSPSGWLAQGAMSPQAACLAATLWLQAVVGGLVPTVLLLAATRAMRQHEREQTRRRQRRGLACPPLEGPVERLLGELPLLFMLCAAQMAWLWLRVAAANLLPLER